MDLLTYLKTNRLTIKGFSEQSDVPYTTVWRIVNEKGTPTARVAKQIDTATDGAVPASVSLKLLAA